MTGLLMLATGCEDDQPRTHRTGDAPSTTLALANAAPVTLTGRVTRSYGSHVVQLGNSPSEPVLVVLPTPRTFPNGVRLEVSGRIRTFARADLEAELGVDLGPEVEGLAGSPCLVAAAVRPL